MMRAEQKWLAFPTAGQFPRVAQVPQTTRTLLPLRTHSRFEGRFAFYTDVGLRFDDVTGRTLTATVKQPCEAFRARCDGRKPTSSKLRVFTKQDLATRHVRRIRLEGCSVSVL